MNAAFTPGVAVDARTVATVCSINSFTHTLSLMPRRTQSCRMVEARLAGSKFGERLPEWMCLTSVSALVRVAICMIVSLSSRVVRAPFTASLASSLERRMVE